MFPLQCRIGGCTNGSNCAEESSWTSVLSDPLQHFTDVRAKEVKNMSEKRYSDYIGVSFWERIAGSSSGELYDDRCWFFFSVAVIEIPNANQ